MVQPVTYVELKIKYKNLCRHKSFVRHLRYNISAKDNLRSELILE